MKALEWKRNLFLDGHELRPATTADAVDLAALMAEPDVVQWWHQDWDAKRWADYLVGLIEDTGTLPLVLEQTPDQTSGQSSGQGDRVTGYVEVYRVGNDVLGRHIEHSETDLGMHIALGRQARGRRLGTAIMRGLVEAATEILDGCTRLVAEPDVRNTRSHRAFDEAGFESLGTVQLADKSARLLAARTDQRPESIQSAPTGGAKQEEALL